MKIILGVFGKSYQHLKSTYDLISYSQFNHDRIKPINKILKDTNFLSMINYQLYSCEECYFDLTLIDFKLTDKSFEKITIQELFLVVTTPEHLVKTKFFNCGEEIPTECVMEWFLHDPYWNQYL